MPRQLRRPLVVFLFVSVPLAAFPAFLSGRAANQSPTSPAASAASNATGLDLTAMNRAVDPCTDFFQFACGAWLATNPIPSDRPRWGRFDELQEHNYEILRRVLETAASSGETATKKIGDYYTACMDEAAIEKRGAAPLEQDLRRIRALGRVADLPGLLAGLHRIGVTAFFTFGAEADFRDAKTVIAIADQGGLGLPDRDYYFRDDARSAAIRTRYVEHVATLAGLLGAADARAATAAQTVMRVETALAKAALDNVSRRDPSRIYHRVTPAELQALTPSFNWSTYFRGVGAPPLQVINVTELDFFRTFGELLATTPLDDIKTYLRWQLIHFDAPILSSAFVNENVRFYGETLRGTTELPPRWRRCVQYTDTHLGESLGQAFVKETFGPSHKADMLDMVRDLESALERDIATLPWMTDTTKKRALTKLHAISNKIGYPDRWRDYEALRIVRGDAAGNAHRAHAFEFRRHVNTIGKPVDKTEWSMTPPTVNAYYHPLENNINFPAGILRPPFYSASADAGVNFGGVGAVIGHELTHGFDDQGRQFDAEGNLNDWWTADDAKAFEERAACLVDQYGGYTAVDDIRLNGKLTLGENTADNGGLRIALLAYLASAGREARTLDGFTPEQRVFLGWGQVWCENRRPEFERLQAQTNPHSPGRYRVNGVVSNMPEFQKAFSCKPDAPMVRANACRVW
jgi:putative endopeptidase